MTKTVCLALTGASGMPYGLRLLECLLAAGCRVQLLYSQVASIVARQEMNEVFSGNLSEADFRGYATTLIGKMVSDPTLREQAQANDTVDAFANGAYEGKLNIAVVDALESHNAMADQALRHEKVFKSLAGLLVGEVYRQLRQPPQGSTGTAI